ncbi:MAG TPA: hypothetical protein VMB53_16130 [Gaiellaceae bacterium]|nr:hypothetical protein [Gaiellaceae bacterium]
MRRTLLLALPLAALAVAAAPVGAGAASAKSCRIDVVHHHDQAVFGHFPTLALAKAYKKKAAAVDFSGLKIENDGCGDFEVMIDGADNPADRGSFSVEAQRAGFPVTFRQLGPVLGKSKGKTYGVFGTFRTLTAANALAWRLATVNFRYIDIAYANGRWLVVMPQVPIKNALSIAQEVNKAGFHIAFEP